MPDGHRRSRTGWADAMEAGPPHPPAHTHRLPPLVRGAIVGLVAAMVCLLVGLVLTAVQVYRVNQYIQGKGEQRDRENSRLQEQQRQGMCDLLDQFPEGGWLERPRDKYGCGPGIPIDQLTPEEQRNLNGRAAPPPPPDAPDGVEVAPDGFALGASPDVQRQEPYYPTPGVAEPPPTVPYPPGFPPPDPVQPTAPPTALAPIADPLCDVLGVCVQSKEN